MAIAHVEIHPLAAGDFYPGDLLKQVMEVDEGFWNKHRELRDRLVKALERALERIRKVRTPEGLDAEFRAGLKRHRAAPK
jgi:leucyl aminopeptidase (aminopeptidase T)